MNLTTLINPSLPYDHHTETVDVIKVYFENFVTLSKSENWREIISQGNIAREAAKKAGRSEDEAKICAQLSSTAFYLGEYDEAFKYVNRCRELSKEIGDFSLLCRALYLESATHRALAAKFNEEEGQKAFYWAVKTAENAGSIYREKKLKDGNLKGKIHFNLGAAHGDNPKGNLEEAKKFYSIAIQCFKEIHATDDVIRTTLRLGKIHLLQKKYDLSQQALNEVRPSISNQRILIHADYLEAQLLVATNNHEKAIEFAKKGLEKAKTLGAKGDELRLESLLKSIVDRNLNQV